MTSRQGAGASGEIEALRLARLMVSGRYRIPWTYAGSVAHSMIRNGLIDEGGYLTTKGLRERAALQSRPSKGKGTANAN